MPIQKLKSLSGRGSKVDMKLRKLKVRGENSLLREICLFYLGYILNYLIQIEKNNKKGIALHPVRIV